MAYNNLRKDCGCTRLELKGCSKECVNFSTCKARLIAEELTRPMPTGRTYKPKPPKRPNRPTNANLAQEYGLTERQVSKAVKESLETGSSIQTILRRKKNEKDSAC